jgi:hypothetical protein
MNAYVSICTLSGQEMLSVHVDSHDPFIILAVRGVNVALTRDEARRAADALRAAALRPSFEDLFEMGGYEDPPGPLAP